ncbi:hypothetical protein M0812_16675 [Anaeramoeba flamelloides]|uniref:Uncharacterized protein n=1 Tax=Anaeramoeba flamelloides TaxID=1746091 RepID=A0AAV7Z9P3_9EUKA|nr:hypothetical protein M0812_16675 [Anaeramoeba flamelloides]
MEITDQEMLNFGDLFWGFGYYLFGSIDDHEIFREKKMRKHFLRALFPNSTSKRRQHKKQLELVTVLLNQNSVLLRPESKTVASLVLNNTNKASQIKHRRRHHVPHPNQFFLNSHWRALFMDPKYLFSSIFEQRINPKTVQPLHPKKRSKKFSPQKVSHPDRTIGILGFKIHKILQKGPKTREQIENETQFPRQRVSLVLSVYKSLKMILEDQTTGYFYWNYEQSVAFPKTTSYFSDLVKAKKTKQLLSNHLSELSKRLMQKVEQKKEISNETRKKLENIFQVLSSKKTQNVVTNNNTNTNTTFNNNNKSKNKANYEQLKKNNDESKPKLPTKSEIQELLTSLCQKRKHLRQLRNYSQSVLDQNKLNSEQFFGSNTINEEKEVDTKTTKQPINRTKKKTKKNQNQQEIPFKRRRSKRRLQQKQKNNFYLINTNTNISTKTNISTNTNTSTPQFEQPNAQNEDHLQILPPKIDSLPSSPIPLFLENNRQDLIETNTSSDDEHEHQLYKNCMQITDTREIYNKSPFTHEEILLRGRSKKETEAVQAILKLRPFFIDQKVNNNLFFSQQSRNSKRQISIWLSLLGNTPSNIIPEFSNNFQKTPKNQNN